jgi:TolB protein
MARAQRRRNRLRCGAVALAAAALLTACGEQRAQMPSNPLLPYLQRKVGRIGFIGLDGNVRSVDQTGAGNTLLTEDAGPDRAARVAIAYSQPTWAPDGRTMAFARTAVTGRRSLTSSIWVAGDEGVAREVYRSDALRPIYLYWSPDSAKLTMLSQPLGSASLELGVIDVGADRYRVLDQGQPYYWSWLPDNSALITHVGGDVRFNDAARLSLVPLDPSGVKSDFNIPPAGFQAPAVSPDGRYMAYVSAAGSGNSGAGAALVMRELNGPDERVLAEVPGFAYFAFAPRGSRIALMTSARPGPAADGQLTVYDTDTATELVLPHEDVIAFFWSPNGRRVAYLVPARAEDEEAGLEVDPVFAREQGRFYAELRVANVQRGTTWRVALFPLSPRFVREQLPFFDQYLRSASLWSPDSRSLAYPALTADGTPGIFVSPASGTLRPQLIAEGDFAHWSP